MEIINIRNTQHYDEVVDRMLALEELPNSKNNAEFNMLAQVVKEFDDLHIPEPPLPSTMRFSEIRNDEDHAAAVDYLIKLNQSTDADAHLEEIKALGELVEDYEVRNGHTLDS